MKLNQAVLLVFVALLMSGCADGIKNYFQKSASNKVIDSKGFHGSKRKPLYNKKYIALAKKNIAEGNDDEDQIEDSNAIYDDEYNLQNSSRKNRKMYLQMMQEEDERMNAASRNSNARYPDLSEVPNKTNQKGIDEESLQRELSQIKSMLHEAKKDLTKYKCPLQQEKVKNKVEDQDYQEQDRERRLRSL